MGFTGLLFTCLFLGGLGCIALYINKPLDFNQFLKVVKSIEDFWLTVVKLPPR